MRNCRTFLPGWIAFALTCIASTEEKSPLIPRDGGEVVERRAGVKGWTDRDYLLTAWPESLEKHRALYRSPMKHTRFEVFRPGYIVVLTPEKERFNQRGKLTLFQVPRMDLKYPSTLHLTNQLITSSW